ncbi:MAG: MBOAT family protein [Oscillospiraceae bacterium]|nr:MBOAT family protein [Oscillospiraceae bacterium]
MNFNSFEYIIFLGGLFSVYYFLPLFLRKIMLLAASFLFYMFWNIKYSLLMFTAIAVTYTGAILLSRFSRHKKLIGGVTILSVISLLVYFKYFNLLISTVNSIFGTGFNSLNIILPVGISFYTFQSIGYVIDVYRGDIDVQKNFLDYALFISFFPQLVAGPIERSTNMMHQIKTKQVFQLEKIKDGLTLIIIGLVEKIVISQRMAILVDAVFNAYSQVNALFLIFAIVCFSLQIYTDFSSYTNIARGSAKLFGYELMENFRAPYLAENIKDFWRRWHISLSSWFTEYLYFPLGGSRVSPTRHLFNVAVVFITSGIWHGADYTFIIWGTLHALAQIVFILKQKHIKTDIHTNKYLNIVITYSFVCFTYIFFRASSATEAFDFISHIFTNFSVSLSSSLELLSLYSTDIYLLIVFALLVFINDHLMLKKGKLENRLNSMPVVRQAAIYSFCLLLIVVLGVYGVNFVEKPFIYFQF